MRFFKSAPQLFNFSFSLCLLIVVSSACVAEEVYICPMHPHIEGSKDDSCPICGMDLVAKPGENTNSHTDNQPIKTSTERSPHTATQSIAIQKTLLQSLGVRVEEATHHTFGKNIRAFGQIVPNMRLEYDVDAHSRGRIAKLLVNAEGDEVKKGDLLYTYYSPDLITAQSDFLIGARNNNAEQRLRLFGMDERSISLLKKKKTFIEEVPFHAPASGTITELNVRQGSHMDAGERVMSIRDFSKVWVIADVPLKDLTFLKTGDGATVTIPETGEHFETQISFIYPINNPSTRTAKVRIEVDNPNNKLRPDTYVDVEFESTPESRLAVPSDAIFYSGNGTYLFIELSPGVFQAALLDVGITSQGLTEVLQGISAGQRFATSGQFMIDAESKIRGIDLTGNKKSSDSHHHGAHH